VPVQLAKLSVSGVDVRELEQWESKPIKASRVDWGTQTIREEHKLDSDSGYSTKVFIYDFVVY